VLHHLRKRNLYITCTGETKSLLVRIFKSSYRRSVVQIYLLSLYLLRHSFFFHLSSSPTSSFSSSRFLSARIPPPSRPHPHPPDMARGRVTPARASRRPSSTCGSGRILSYPACTSHLVPFPPSPQTVAATSSFLRVAAMDSPSPVWPHVANMASYAICSEFDFGDS
jgi:hypothetical protein